MEGVKRGKGSCTEQLGPLDVSNLAPNKKSDQKQNQQHFRHSKQHPLWSLIRKILFTHITFRRYSLRPPLILNHSIFTQQSIPFSFFFLLTLLPSSFSLFFLSIVAPNPKPKPKSALCFCWLPPPSHLASVALLSLSLTRVPHFHPISIPFHTEYYQPIQIKIGQILIFDRYLIRLNINILSMSTVWIVKMQLSKIYNSKLVIFVIFLKFQKECLEHTGVHE